MEGPVLLNRSPTGSHKTAQEQLHGAAVVRHPGSGTQYIFTLKGLYSVIPCGTLSGYVPRVLVNPGWRGSAADPGLLGVTATR